MLWMCYQMMPVRESVRNVVNVLHQVMLVMESLHNVVNVLPSDAS